jgi:hypothetical protein
MTRDECAEEIYKKGKANLTLIEFVLYHLEEMDLIKFESERESIIKEAERILKSDLVILPSSVDSVIKRLIALVK